MEATSSAQELMVQFHVTVTLLRASCDWKEKPAPHLPWSPVACLALHLAVMQAHSQAM